VAFRQRRKKTVLSHSDPSWIDGSFVYSTKEAWVNAMRTFENGTFKMVGDPIMGMPPLNTQRIPVSML
jgi:dual oxidase